MAHNARLGSGLLTYPSAAGTIPSYLDAQQWLFTAAALRRWLADHLGGEGVYSGGAVDETELGGSGTTYPAFTAIVDDDGSPAQAFFFSATGSSAITFNETDTAAGEARLYLVITPLSGVSPAAAVGGLGDFEFVADDVANGAPDDSLLLGAGQIVTSALTDFTESVARPYLARLALPVASTAPANPIEGEVYYDSDDHIAYVWNGTSWDAMNAGP